MIISLYLEIKSRFVLECIPVLVKGRISGIDSQKKFYDRMPANASLKEVIQSTKGLPLPIFFLSEIDSTLLSAGRLLWSQVKFGGYGQSAVHSLRFQHSVQSGSQASLSLPSTSNHHARRCGYEGLQRAWRFSLSANRLRRLNLSVLFSLVVVQPSWSPFFG